MYQRESPSPVFDASESPALRQVKPLPKRRRTMAGMATGHDHISLNHQQSGGMTTPSFTAHGAAASALLQQGLGVLQQHTGQSALEMLASATTGLPIEELLSGTAPLSTRMALQNYYMPLLGTVQNFLAANAAAVTASNGVNVEVASNPGATSDHHQPITANLAAVANAAAFTGAGRSGQPPVSLPDMDALEFGVHFAAVAAGVAMSGLGGLGLGFPGTNMGQAPPAPTSTSTGSHPRDEEDPKVDGECPDHMQQPGNTKKRKVPANVGGSPRGSGARGEVDHDGGSSRAYGFDRHDDDGQAGEHTSRDGHECTYDCQDRPASDSTSPSATLGYPPPPFPGQLSLVVKKRGKMTAVTLAGLQHKEMLKARKRQLAAVMGALSHGDTLALDQALSASFPSLTGFGSAMGSSMTGIGDDEDRKPRLRRSKRSNVRLARAMKLLLQTPERRIPHPDAVPVPSGLFNFVHSSETADRLIATKAEVASLRKQFERELERQASKAAKMVGQAGGNKAMARAGGGKAKRERLERERIARVEKAQGQKLKVDLNTPTVKVGSKDARQTLSGGVPVISNALGGGKSKPKKKKRSALANASNPHHLRNYVPSRLPNSGAPGTDGGNGFGSQNANLIWPLPIRFLSAEIPPRRKNGQHPEEAKSAGSLMQPDDEWICAFCEYDLFYGSDRAYRRGVKNRKKILKRRRRAREKAAAAASGAKTVVSKGMAPAEAQGEQDFDEYEDDEEEVEEYGNAPVQNLGRAKTGPDKDGRVGLG